MSLSALGTGTLNYFDGSAWQQVGGAADPATNWPASILNSTVTVTTAGTAHTMGNYTQVTASVSEDVGWVTIAADNFGNGVNTSALVDLAVGAAGAEVVKFESVPIGFSNYNQPVSVPLAIPAGSRVAVRAQSVRTNQAISVQVILNRPTSATTPTSLVTLGADRAASGGSVICSTNNVWYEVVASTAANYRAIVGVPVVQGTNTISTDPVLTWNVGTGASGSETAVITERFSTTVNEIMGFWARMPSYGYYGTTIAAGSRLSIRTVNAGRAYLSGIIFGVPA